MATPYLVITDGTTTITIMNNGAGTNYALNDDKGGWVPSIAGLRESPLGGRGPYEDVVETMNLTLMDTTAAGVYTRLDTLNRLLDQAERWYKGENVTAVLVKYAPASSTVSSDSTPLQAAILGRASGNETSGIGLTPHWNEGPFASFQLDITLRFVRRGMWLLSETSAASSATTNGDLASITIAATDNYSPTRLSITNFGSGKTGGSEQYWGGFMVLSDVANTIDIVNAEGAASGAFTSFNDSAQSARNTNVLRYTPAVTTEVESANITTVGLRTGARLVAVLANIRNNSATTSFSVRFRAHSGTTQYTPGFYVAPNSTPYPHWQFMGLFSSSGLAAISSFYVLVTASAASGTMDIDTIVLCDVSNNTTQILGLLDHTSGATGSGTTLQIDHNLLDNQTPTVIADSGADWPHEYTGDPVISTKGGTLYGILLCTGSSSSTPGNRWRQYDVGGASVYSNTWTANRYTGYLSPR